MISAVRKSQVFEEHRVPTEGNEWLHAKLMFPKPPKRPKRLVVMAPLVGGSASQSLIIFRALTRRGSIIMSFEYRGHTRSSGTFELDQTIVDTRYALEWASNYAKGQKLPLHGFATCFGTVPLLAQFANGRQCVPLSSISAISGLFRLDQILRFEDFATVLSRYLGTRLDTTMLLEGVRSRSLDLSVDLFSNALQEYLKGHFPELRIGRDYFEELHYDRANTAQTLSQLAGARYLDNVTLPPQIPCRFYYGRKDELFDLHTQAGRTAYRDQILALIPHAQLHELDFDHYGRGPDHKKTIDSLGDLFEECERGGTTVD